MVATSSYGVSSCFLQMALRSYTHIQGATSVSRVNSKYHRNTCQLAFVAGLATHSLCRAYPFLPRQHNIASIAIWFLTHQRLNQEVRCLQKILNSLCWSSASQSYQGWSTFSCKPSSHDIILGPTVPSVNLHLYLELCQRL